MQRSPCYRPRSILDAVHRQGKLERIRACWLTAYQQGDGQRTRAERISRQRPM